MASGSRGWVVPTVIGVVVLSVLVAVLGWKLGERDAKNLVQTPIGGGGGPTGTSSPTGATEKACPAPTVRAANNAGAKSAVTQLLYIRTDSAEVWICHDTSGTLYYQGHNGLGGITEANSDRTLFLTDVKADGNAFVATNTSRSGNHTFYRVTTELLTVSDDDGEKIRQVVVVHEP